MNINIIEIENYTLEECYDASTDEMFYDVFYSGKYIGELDKCDVEPYMEDDKVVDENGLLDLVESL